MTFEGHVDTTDRQTGSAENSGQCWDWQLGKGEMTECTTLPVSSLLNLFC